MICNRDQLIALAPIVGMARHKRQEHGVSSGLSEAGYDIRIKQDIVFLPGNFEGLVPYGNRDEKGRLGFKKIRVDQQSVWGAHQLTPGRFTIASAMEEFNMPLNLVGIVHDKSTWARRGLSVFNTVIEPGFRGGLTLELVYHGNTELVIPAGAGIAQVIFHLITNPTQYEGKYQHQSTDPTPARDS